MQYGKTLKQLSDEAKQRLTDHTGSGNILELEHAIEKAVIISEGDTLTMDCFHLPRNIMSQPTVHQVSTLEEMEKQMIAKAINQCDGTLSAVAMQLGSTRQTLYNKMKKCGL